MKTITAVFKPFKLDEVKAALQELRNGAFVVAEVKGMGNRGGVATELYRGAEYVVQWLPKVLITITVKDNEVDKAVAAIQKAARTGRIGDGRITVTPIEQFIHIRSGLDEVQAETQERVNA